ncbi:MAG: hypothetical protein S0880_14370 [Actinomycetota bacterium]|nr:hypothetical protein [Actinomycetota bacterium]
MISDDDAGRLAELVPHVAVRTIPGAGHLIACDAPAAMAEALVAAMAGPVADRPGHGRSAQPT